MRRRIASLSMGMLRAVNASLGRTLGYKVKKVRRTSMSAMSSESSESVDMSSEMSSDASTPAAPDWSTAKATYSAPEPGVDRLLDRPVFILAPVRSGSTLLRLLLNGHSQLHAPHESHFRRLEVRWSTKLAGRSMKALGLHRGDLEHLLWDRVLHRELVRSGKSFIVEKTPANVFVWRRLADCWPDARFIFLIRHPVSIAQSWHEADPDRRSLEEAGRNALGYMNAVEAARNGLDGHTVRYEDLTADPTATLQGICEFLGVDWEPAMLDYGRHLRGELRKGLGDWRPKVRSGKVQPSRPLPRPDEIPDYLRPICEAWGYLPEPDHIAVRQGQPGYALRRLSSDGERATGHRLSRHADGW